MLKKIYVQNIFCSKKHISSKKNWWVIFLMQKVISIGGSLMQQRVNKGKEGGEGEFIPISLIPNLGGTYIPSLDLGTWT